MQQRAQLGTGVLILKDDLLLLQKRASSHGEGTWSTPGGHIEYGETPERTAIRETEEEVGLTIGGGRIVAITNDVFENEEKHYVTLWLLAEDIGDDPIILKADETSDYGWFPLDALPSPLFLPMQTLLQGGSLIPFDLSSLA